MTDLEQWTGTRESQEADQFYQKSVLFTDLIDLMPASPVRVHAVRSFTDHLRHSDADRVRRGLWFFFVNRLLETSRGRDRALILSLMEASGHPGLRLYARLERVLPEERKPG